MKKHLFIKLSLLLLLVICNTHAWGKYLYLSTANFIDWEKDNATFKLDPGTGSDVTGVKIYDHMYRFDVPKATGTMYFKRYNSSGGTLWNQFPVDYNASYNVYKVTSWNRDGCSSQCSSGTYDNSITMKEIYLDVHTKWYQDGPLFKLTTGGTTYTAVGFAGTNLVLFSVPSPSGNLYFERWKSDNSTRWNTAETTYNSSYNAYEITDWGAVSASYNVKIVDKPNYIYFDNSQIAFGTSNAYLVIGHDKPTAYSSTYAFGSKPIPNTKLYYYNNTANTWRDATYFAFLQNSSSFGSGSWGSSNLSTASKYTAAYTTATDLSWDKMYLFVPASGSNGASLTLNTYSAASDMNSTQTIKYAISIDNGSTYTELTSGNTPAKIQISAYKFADGTYNSVSNSSNSKFINANSSGTYSQSVPAGYVSKTTLGYSSVQTGYTFVDWKDAVNDGNTVTSTYYPTGEKTVYARFKSILVTSITLNKTSTTLTAGGDTETLTTTVLPANALDKTVTWSTSNSSIATVSNGVVTPRAEGTCTITATAHDGSGKSATCTVTVEAGVPTHTLTWNLDGGTATGGTAAGSVAEGAALTPPTVTKVGYDFAGWSPAVPATMPSSDATYTATWTKVYASGTYQFDGHLTVGTSPSYTVTTTATNYTAKRADNIFFSATKIEFEGTDGTPEGDGDNFKGWKVKASTTIKFFVEDNSDVQVSIGSIGGGTCTITYTDQSSVEHNNTAISAGSYETIYEVKAGTMVTISMAPSSDKSITLKRIAISGSASCVAPTAVNISGTYHYFPGETISLTAAAEGGSGTPTTYQWYKGGTADGNIIKGATSATYTKATCTFADAGSYYCKVTRGGSCSTFSGNYDVKILRLYVKYSKGGNPYGYVDFEKVEGTTATASISLGSNWTYGFNIADGCGHYYGNNGTMQYNSYGPWVTNQNGTDCGLTTTNAGTYIFTINYSTWSQITTTVTFPSCSDPGLAFASASKSVTLCDDAPTNALTNTHGVTVSYESSDETVATVASDGTLTIKKAGTTTITASSLEQTVSAVTYCADNASYTLTVNASTAAGLAYGTSTIKKDVGDDAFTNTLTNSNSLSVTYSSSDEDVATVASDGTVTIKAAGTTTITASSDQQKITSTCYAAGSATYTLTVYPVYTVSYNAMGGTCGTESANTVAGEVTLPTPTHASYSFDGWYTTAGVKAGNAGAKYSPSGKITLYAKWSGSCAGGGGSGTTVSIFDGAVDETNAKSSDRYNPDHKEYYTNATTGFQYKTLGIKDELADVSTPTSYTNRGSYVKAIRMNGSGGSNYIELKMPTGYTAKLFVAYSGYSSTNQKFGVHTSTGTTPNGSNCDTWNATASDGTTVYTATIDLSANTTYYLSGGGSSCLFEEVKVTLTPAGATPCYTVTYDGNGATSGYTNDPVQYAKDAEPIVLDCGYEKTGYAFIGWAEGTTHRDAGTVDYQPGGHITSISDDVTLYAIWKQIKYFKGTSSSSWNTSGNWSPSGVPAITDPVVIQANVTVDTDEAKALSVDIESGNTLTIGAGMALIIEKTLTKAGSATAASDVIINSTRAAGVGALIIGGETGTNKATVNFATKVKRESGTGNWINQFIGSPFSDCTPYVDYALQIYKFCADNSGNRGYWHKLSSGDEMVEFYGYNVLYNDNNFLEVNWTGTLNKSDEVTVTGTNYQTDNLFANSWPAPIHISAFEAGDFTNFDPTIYIFNAGTPQQEGSMSSTGTATDPGTYVTIPINSGEWLTGTLSVIPAMQAFFVKATGASPTLKFDYSKLVYTPALTSVDITPTRAPRRSAEVAPEVIRLHVAGENGWAENTYVLGREDFTEGYDRGWDGRYMEGEDTNPQLYTPTTDGYMAVNCVPEIEGTVVGFRKGSSDNNYIFSFDYDGDEVWYLNDQKAQKSTQIMNGQTYAFVSEAGDNAARFVISATPINKIATGCESVGTEAAKVRKLIINDKVYIIRGGQVFDVLGKTIKK